MRTILLLLCGLILGNLITAASAYGQLVADRFFPPVVAAGQSTEVKLEGKFPQWPVQFDIDLDGIQITCGEKSGTITVTVPPQSTSGAVWVRAYNQRSVTKVLPLLVSSANVSNETEPNNKRGEANEIVMPAAVGGKLSKSNDVDTFRVSVKAGDRLIVRSVANQILKSPMDAVLQLSDLRGNILQQSDDVNGLDPLLVYQSEEDADLLVRMVAFPETPNSTVGFSGAATFVYALQMSTGPVVDHAFPVDQQSAQVFGWNLSSKPEVLRQASTGIAPDTVTVKDAIGWAWIHEGGSFEPTKLGSDNRIEQLPATIWGHLFDQGEKAVYRFAAKAGKKYRVDVDAKRFGFPLDGFVRIVDAASGKELFSNDDLSRGGYDCGTNFSVKVDQEIEIHLSDVVDGFGSQHFYRMSIRELEPRFALTLADDHFTGKATDEKATDEEVSYEGQVTIGVTRVDGFSSKIRIEAKGLPDGVTSKPVFSEPKGGSSKSVQLKFSSSQPIATSQFQIVGKAMDKDDQPVGENVTARFEIRPEIYARKLWLSIPSK